MKRTLLCLLLAAGMTASGQQIKPMFSDREKSSAIDSLILTLKEHYIFPDVAQKIGDYLHQQDHQGVYKKISDQNAFAKVMTRDMRTISHDLHLGMWYTEDVQLPEPEHDMMKTPEADKPELKKLLQRTNYGITKLDVLQGNIGYLDMNVFCTPEFAGDNYAAALNYLANTDALIIDLRECRGSTSPDAIPFVASYFFNEPVHLNDLHWRKDNALTQYWTYAYVTGKKYLDKPIYILISRDTFSGAEEFAYDMQNLKRAILIGQTTGGGANPGGDLRVNSHFRAFIPVGRAESPVTHTNWENKGVKPDTLIHPKLALFKARELAMKYSLQHDSDPRWQNALIHWLDDLKKETPLLKPVTFELPGFPDAGSVSVAGSFNGWSTSQDKMERKGNKWILTTMSEPGKITYKFMVDGAWMTDPANPLTEPDREFVNSVKIVQ